MDTPPSLANRLVWLRGDASARTMSVAAGLSPGMWARLETGSRPSPRAATLERIAKTCNVSLDWLALGKGDPPDPEAVRAAVEAARAHTANDNASPTVPPAAPAACAARAA